MRLPSAKHFAPIVARLLLLSTALGIAACASSGPTRPKQVESHDDGGFSIAEEVHVSGRARADFEEALRLLKHKDYQRGIELLQQVTEAAPDVTAPYIDLGIAYRQVDDLDKAEASLKKALELNPRHPVAHNELGIVYRRTGRFEDARHSYEKALSLHPDFHFARLNLAILCDLYLNDLPCALQNYKAYLQAVPDDKKAAMWISDLQSRIGK